MWKAADFMWAWAKATSWDFRLQIFFSAVLVFGTGMNAKMVERAMEGADILQILHAGLAALRESALQR